MKSVRIFSALFSLFLIVNLPVFSQDYSYYSTQAKTDYDNKNYYQAIDNATRSLDLYKNGAAYWYRGMGRYHVNNYVDAADDFSNALTYYSDNVSLGGLYYWRALCRYNQKNYKDAIPDFEQARSYGYENKSNMFSCLGFSYYETGNYDKAIESYNNAITYTAGDGDLADLYNWRGDANNNLFKYDEAIQDYTKAIGLNPGFSNAYWSRGRVRSSNFQYDLASGDYTSAINILEKANDAGKVNDLSALYNARGRNEYNLGKYDDAGVDLQKSLALNANNSGANWNMGDLKLALREYTDASRYYLQAESLLTDDYSRESVYSSLYQCSIDQLDYRQALEYINDAIKLNAAYGDYFSKRAHVYFAEKNYQASLVDYNKVISLYQDDQYGLYKTDRANAYISRADVKKKLMDNAGALEDYKNAVLEDTSNVYAIYHIARFYKQVLKLGDKATAYLQKAAALSAARDSVSWYASELAYVKVISGEKQAAIDIITRLIKTDTQKNDKARITWDIYDAACIYALAGDAQKALKFLDNALAAGFDLDDHLYNDEDLDSIRLLPGYALILAKYKIPQPKI